MLPQPFFVGFVLSRQDEPLVAAPVAFALYGDVPDIEAFAQLRFDGVDDRLCPADRHIFDTDVRFEVDV